MGTNGLYIKKYVRLSNEEAVILSERAKELDMKESEFIRYIISHKNEEYGGVRKLILGLVNQTNEISDRVKEVIDNFERENITSEDKEVLKAYILKLNEGVANVIRKLDRR